MTTVYVTKYALTKGIFTIDAEPVGNWKYAVQIPRSCGFFLKQNEFALLMAEAIDQAEAKRKKRIALLERSIAKLKSLDFKQETTT